MSPSPQRRRIAAMLAQLDQTSEEYIIAKDAFDSARIEYEAAKEKFASMRRLAISVLSRDDWYRWRAEHENVQYSGLKIGDAIAEVLETRAMDSASEHWKSDCKTPYRPAMSLDAIQETLERGGFEFRSATPLREVNAAVINLDRAKKDGQGYKYSRSDEVLGWFRPKPKQAEPLDGPPPPPEDESFWETDQTIPPPQEDDNVPF